MEKDNSYKKMKIIGMVIIIVLISLSLYVGANYFILTWIKPGVKEPLFLITRKEALRVDEIANGLLNALSLVITAYFSYVVYKVSLKNSDLSQSIVDLELTKKVESDEKESQSRIANSFHLYYSLSNCFKAFIEILYGKKNGIKYKIDTEWIQTVPYLRQYISIQNIELLYEFYRDLVRLNDQVDGKFNKEFSNELKERYFNNVFIDIYREDNVINEIHSLNFSYLKLISQIGYLAKLVQPSGIEYKTLDGNKKELITLFYRDNDEYFDKSYVTLLREMNQTQVSMQVINENPINIEDLLTMFNLELLSFSDKNLIENIINEYNDNDFSIDISISKNEIQCGYISKETKRFFEPHCELILCAAFKEKLMNGKCIINQVDSLEIDIHDFKYLIGEFQDYDLINGIVIAGHYNEKSSNTIYVNYLKNNKIVKSSDRYLKEETITVKECTHQDNGVVCCDIYKTSLIEFEKSIVGVHRGSYSGIMGLTSLENGEIDQLCLTEIGSIIRYASRDIYEIIPIVNSTLDGGKYISYDDISISSKVVNKQLKDDNGEIYYKGVKVYDKGFNCNVVNNIDNLTHNLKEIILREANEK